MRSRYSVAVLLSTQVVILAAGGHPDSANAQEPSVDGLSGAALPSGACQLALHGIASGGHDPAGTSAPSTDRRESGSPELREIQQRLLRLEVQNADLARQNEQLRNSLGVGLDGEHLSQKPPAGDVIPASAVESPADAAQAQAAGIAAGMFELKSGMEKLGAGVEELGKNLTVTTAYKDFGFKLALFGAISGEMIFADARPLLPSAVSLVSPDFGRDTQIAQISARSSYLGAAAVGPCVGSFQSGGLVLAYLYSSSIADDNYGFFIARAYGELKNENWRFSVGVDGDVISPLDPEMIDWAAGRGAGDLGFLRAQFRVERYFHPSDETQVTAQFALTDPIPTNYENFSLIEGLTESNGWPNVEGRLAVGFGPRSSAAV